jgi:hypothetical protein
LHCTVRPVRTFSVPCLALGDSLAIGVGQARPDCYVAAITGITLERYVRIFPGMRHVRTAIISLGVNDGEAVATIALRLPHMVSWGGSVVRLADGAGRDHRRVAS